MSFNSDFSSIIHDVLAAAPECLGEVVRTSDQTCSVIDLGTVSDKAWSVLVEFGRVAANLDNVVRYIDFVGGVDANIANILASAGRVEVKSSATEGDKEFVAVAILSARDYISSAELRVDLVGSLDLQEYLNVGKLPVESGELFSILIEKNLVDDNAETYTHILAADWPTRERYIEASSEFIHYVTPELLKGDLGAFLESSKISYTAKVSVVSNCERYVADSTKRDLRALARFAALHAIQFSLEVVSTLAKGSARVEDILALLSPHLNNLSLEQVRPILLSLGSEYSKLTSPGREVVKLAATKLNADLLKMLKSRGIVSSYSLSSDRDSLVAYKKYKLI